MIEAVAVVMPAPLWVAETIRRESVLLGVS